MSRFDSFYQNYLKHLDLVRSQPGQEIKYVELITNLYPLANKVYGDEVQNILDKENITQTMALLQKHLREDVLLKIESYQLMNNQLIIKSEGTVKSFPLIKPGLFLKKVFKITESNPYFYLLLSFCCQSANFDAIQLFQKL